jgi:Winged helix DNA-binding domain
MKLMPAGEAQSALLRKYLRAYGPATLTDFSHWAGIPVAKVKALGPQVDSEIVEIATGKRPLVMMREDMAELEKAGDRSISIRLLPNFDAYLLAHRDKDHLLSAKHYKRVYRNQGWISPVVLIDGAVAGVWSHKLQGKRLRVDVEPFGKLSKAERAGIEREAEQLAQFFESDLGMAFGRK